MTERLLVLASFALAWVPLFLRSNREAWLVTLGGVTGFALLPWAVAGSFKWVRTGSREETAGAPTQRRRVFVAAGASILPLAASLGLLLFWLNGRPRQRPSGGIRNRLPQ